MKTYMCPQIIEDLCHSIDIIAVSLIDGGSASQDIPVQVKENNEFSFCWGDTYEDEDKE